MDDVLGYVNVPVTVLLAVAVILLFYIYSKGRLTFLEDNGIHGPKPTLFFGHLLDIARRGLVYCVEDWTKTYGKVFGIYFGSRPSVFVSDLDILKEILVKNFPNFTDRRILGLSQYPISTGVFFAGGAQWKRIRNIITPAFSGGKLKLISKGINQSALTLSNNFAASAEKNDIVDIKQYFGAYTMDVIASSAFGIDINSQRDFNNPFVMNSQKILKSSFLAQPGFIIGCVFPKTVPLLKALGLNFFPNDAIQFFISSVKEMIQQRKEHTSSVQDRQLDFLQLLLNAELPEHEGDSPKESGNQKDNQPSYKKLSTDEIIGQAFLFFIAGYDTTGSTLQFMAYSLATNPGVQEKVVEEINTELENEEPNYENISKLKYLDCVINETLRLYPPVSVVNREVAETVTINGVTLPKGSSVSVPIFSIHRLAEYHPEPEKFKPERFASEADMKPLAFLPFGFGPRQCIGMRLALVEAKIALVHVLRKVKFSKTNDTPDKLEFKNAGILTPEKTIMLRVEPRMEV